MSAPASQTRPGEGSAQRVPAEAPARRAPVRKAWVEPNLRSAGPSVDREPLSTMFLSAGGMASFLLSFVLVLSLALLVAG